MVISLVLLFLTSISLSFYEERLLLRDKVMVYVVLGITMILIAGFREVGIVPDTEAYEAMFYAKSNSFSTKITEPTFTFLSETLHSWDFGITALFLIYAIISIPLRLTAIWKLSSIPLFTLTVYISHYYQLHDVVQMRCAVASALFLLALYYRLQQQKLYSLLCIVVGFFFHFSAIVGLLIFVINNKPLKNWQIAVLYSIIPIGIVFSILGFDIAQFIPSEIGGTKLELYREMKEKGIEGDLEGIPFYRDPAILSSICLFYGCLFFNRLLSEKNHYLPIFLKIMGIAFICKFTLANLSSVVASRLFEYFDIVSIFLWTSAIYAFRPIEMGKTVIYLASTLIFLSGSLFYILVKS